MLKDIMRIGLVTLVMLWVRDGWAAQYTAFSLKVAKQRIERD